MFTARIPSHKIDRPRIDPEFYSPEKLEALGWRNKWLDRLITLEDLSSRITDGTHITPDYITEGVHFLSSTNINCCSVDFQRTQFISKHAYEEFAKSNCNPGHGDLLIAKNGKIGTAAQYLPSHPPCSLFVSVALIRKPEGIDRDYLAIFLNSKGGWSQFSRASKTGVITNLHLEEIREIEVVQCAPIVQKYIGDKVRQAERLRAFANSIAVHLIERFSLRDHIQAFRTSKNHQCSTRNLASERLDAPFYLPEHIELRKALQCESAVPLGTYCQLVAERWKKSELEFSYFEIGSLDVGAGRITPTKTKTRNAASRAQRLLKQWDVLVSTVRPNRKNVGFVTQGNAEGIPLVASTGFAVLRFQDKETAAFFHSWLRSDVATQQLVQWNAGGSYPAIEEEVVPRILVPAFSANTIREIGRKCIAGMQARDLTANLCNAAKLLVEALIERKITEDELIYAQTRLEQGDDAADRAILSRLFEGGWDAKETRPLFPDLDAYYETLRMVEREQTEAAAK
jgi:type I restriction enzyme S subunit